MAGRKFYNKKRQQNTKRHLLCNNLDRHHCIEDFIPSLMKSVILLDLFPTNGLSAETPTQNPDPRATLDTPDASETRSYEFQASNAKIQNYTSNFRKRTHSLSQGQGTLNSKEYSNVLHSVYKEEMCHDHVHKLLIISVHAVFLESGFVCLDSVAEKKIDGFHLPVDWSSKKTVNVQYTLPYLQDGAGAGVLETVGLKFQAMGKFIYVHGALSRNSPVAFVRLDASRFVPSINFICRSNFVSTVPTEEDGSCKSFNERELYELWKIAKDGLALPLLTDLCVKTGLEPPPCFSYLLMDFKHKILEFLSAIDLARVSCVSSELRYLSSNNGLWKQKFVEEFALSYSEEPSEGDWKEKYLTEREKEKRKKRSRRRILVGHFHVGHG